VDVPDQFQEIGIFFADDGLVSVLEEMARAFMSFVEGNGIAGHEPSHNFAEWCEARAQKEVKMVRDQAPGITLGLAFFEDDGQATEK